MQLEWRSNDLQLVGFGVFIGWIIMKNFEVLCGNPLENYIEDLSQNVKTLNFIGVGILLTLFVLITMESVKWYRHVKSESMQVKINSQAKDMTTTVLTQLTEVLKQFEAEREKLKPKEVVYIQDLNSESESEKW